MIEQQTEIDQLSPAEEQQAASTERVSDLAPSPGPVGPALLVDRCLVSSQAFVNVLRWEIAEDFLGDLHEIRFSSSDESRTRYRVVIAGKDQNLPDRQIVPRAWVWREGVIGGPTSVTVEARSTDGTEVTIDASITGTVH